MFNTDNGRGDHNMQCVFLCGEHGSLFFTPQLAGRTPNLAARCEQSTVHALPKKKCLDNFVRGVV